MTPQDAGDPAGSEDAADPPPVADEPARTGQQPGQDPLDAAEAVLAAADAESTYKSLLSLARTGHGELLQTLEYNPSLEFHDPTCVKVEPEPQGLDAVDLYAHAAFPEFDRILLEPMLDPRYDHLLQPPPAPAVPRAARTSRW